MGYSIVHDCDLPTVTCKTCNGRGYTTCDKYGLDPDWCPECGGPGEYALDLSELMTLAHNLSTGAALCRAFELGGAQELRNQFWFAKDKDRRFGADWSPGCQRSAP